MKKTIKIILISVLVILIISIANVCHYVMIGQNKSTDKLARGEELNLYECVSIYQMNMAVYSIGWILSPEAAEQAWLMTFPHKHWVVRYNDFFRESEMLYKFPIEKGVRKLDYPLNEITSTGNTKELRYALALDGGIHEKLEEDPLVETCTVFAEYSKYIGIYKIGPIKLELNWALLRYIQDKGWIYPFTITYFAN